MLFTSTVGMLIAPYKSWQIQNILGGLLGIAFAAFAAGILNQILEQDIDKKMRRTQNRPLAKNRISSSSAIKTCIGFSFLSSIILISFTNLLTLSLTAFSMIGYSWFYTQILKPNTSQNIVIGGLFGAMPPLLGYCALTNEITAPPLVLVAIIYTWTPPHFWCLALTKIDEYQHSNLPMLPVTHGIHYTKISILAYAVLLIICTQMLFLIGTCNYVYWILVNILNLLFVSRLIKVYHQDQPSVYMKSFIFSNIYLAALFTVIILDLLWQSLNVPLSISA
jgi:protoheme IX farnesyltransferase